MNRCEREERGGDEEGVKGVSLSRDWFHDAAAGDEGWNRWGDWDHWRLDEEKRAAMVKVNQARSFAYWADGLKTKQIKAQTFKGLGLNLVDRLELGVVLGTGTANFILNNLY